MKKSDDVVAKRHEKTVEPLSGYNVLGYADGLTDLQDDKPSPDADIKAQLAEMQAKLRALTAPGMPMGQPVSIPGGAFVVRQPMTQLEKLRARYADNEYIDQGMSSDSNGMPPTPTDDPDWDYHWLRAWVGEKVDSENMHIKQSGPLRYVFADPANPRLRHMAPYQTSDVVQGNLQASTQHGVIRCGDLVLAMVPKSQRRKWLDKLEYDVHARRIAMLEETKKDFDSIARHKGFKSADQFLNHADNEIVIDKRMNDDDTEA